ncbi:capsular polysaccharide export protein, LipB/KpsS family [Meridianimarinicoccus sp. RP-17]
MTRASYIVLRYGRAEPDALLDAVVPEDGPVQHVSARAVRLQGFAQTPDRAAESLRRARRQPGPGPHRSLKRWLYALQYNAFRARMDAAPGTVAIVWNGLTGTRLAFAAAARDAGRACIFVERAPLPGRITVDPRGVNAASSLARDAAFFRDWAQHTPRPAGPGWRALGGSLVARASRRAGVAQGKADGVLSGRPFLFCPLQVQDDTQVTRFAGWCGGMEGFLRALSDAVAHLPDGWHLRLKEHPSSKRSLAAALAGMQTRHGDRVVVDNTTDTFEQVAASRGVVTLNSSVGLQAFFHDKNVIVLGEALFRIPGVICAADGPDQLARLFAHPGEAGYDADLRDAFMRYLDEVYYPPVTTDAAGRPTIDRARLDPKFAAARAAAAAWAEP